MFSWVLLTVFLAAPGVPPQPEIPGSVFADKTACEMAAVRHNMTSGRSYQRCVEKLGDTLVTGAYLPKNAFAAATTAMPARIALPPTPARPAPIAPPSAQPTRPIAATPEAAPSNAINEGAAAGIATGSASAAGSSAIAALPTANCGGTPTPYFTRAAWTPGVNGCDPGERVDRTTADDARRIIAAAGYSRARDLRKGCDNVWHAKVDRGICYLTVAVSPRGEIIQESD